MNNEWIKFSEWVKYSDRSNEEHVFIIDHEDWLDYLNLYETSWMMFVWNSNNADGDFGWPGKEHE